MPNFETTLKHRLPPLLRDDLGRQQIQDSLSGISTTLFESTRLQAASEDERAKKLGKVGEAMAEAYLGDRPNASFLGRRVEIYVIRQRAPAGVDLVGFQQHGN